MFMKAMPVVFGLALITTMAIADEPRVAFPANYATSFKNYLSLDRTQNEDQMRNRPAPRSRPMASPIM